MFSELIFFFTLLKKNTHEKFLGFNCVKKERERGSHTFVDILTSDVVIKVVRTCETTCLSLLFDCVMLYGSETANWQSAIQNHR